MTASVEVQVRARSENSHIAAICIGEYTVNLHRQIDADVRQCWHILFDELKAPTLFQHIAWHEAFLASRHDPAMHGELIFVVVSHGNAPVALLPFCYRHGRRYGLPIRILELLLPTDMGVRDLLIRDDINGGKVLDCVLNHAFPRAGYYWDVVDLPDITATSTTYRAFEQLRTRRKIAVYHHDSNRLKTAVERGQCFQHVSKSHVKKTKRKRKNLDALGKVECELITDPAALPSALELFIYLEDSGWKGSAGEKTSLRHDLPQKAFYESLVNNSAPELNCCMALMRLDGKPIAANLCTRTGNTLWMLKITYADEYHDYSPGNLILLFLLEYFAEDNGIEYISFITGGEWTWRWHPERVPTYECAIYSMRPAGIAVAAIEMAKNLGRQLRTRWRHRTAQSESGSAAEDAD